MLSIGPCYHFYFLNFIREPLILVLCRYSPKRQASKNMQTFRPSPKEKPDFLLRIHQLPCKTHKVANKLLPNPSTSQSPNNFPSVNSLHAKANFLSRRWTWCATPCNAVAAPAERWAASSRRTSKLVNYSCRHLSVRGWGIWQQARSLLLRIGGSVEWSSWSSRYVVILDSWLWFVFWCLIVIFVWRWGARIQGRE
jgi:hypothetical protein